MTRLFQLVFLAAASLSLQAAPIFWAVGSDNNGLPNQLLRIDVDGSSVTAVATIGSDPNYVYNGGLVVNSPTSFTGFQNDALSAVGMVGFDDTGAVGSPTALGTFRPMGLTDSPTGLHWLEQDGGGDLSLNNTSALNLALGIQGGFGGGLTYRSTDGLFYALAGDGAALYAIDPGNSVTLAANLVEGLVGGLVWDSTADLFYAIGQNGSNESVLYSFAPGNLNPTLNPLLNLSQQGFLGVTWSALAIEPAEVPEPSTLLLAGAGLLALGVFKRKRA